MSYTTTTYHIVLRTHCSERTISEAHERDFYAYVLGLVDNIGGKLYRIGGMPDHVHLCLSLPATVAMADFVQRLKTMTSKWLRANPDFPHWRGWSREYAGFTYSLSERDVVVNYIKNQKEHHRHLTFAEEYKKFLEENGITVKDEYFLKD